MYLLSVLHDALSGSSVLCLSFVTGEKGELCRGWCSDTCWLFFKESSGWHLSWKLTTWISVKCCPEYCWLSNRWREKGNNQFAMRHWGEDFWQGGTVTKGTAFWVWFGLFVFKANSTQRHVLGQSLSFISYLCGRSSLVSSSNLEVPKHWFIFLILFCVEDMF